MRRGWLLFLAGAVWCQTAAPPLKPFRIETGFHLDAIRGIDTDADEHYLVSVSNDKTARVWDLRSGELLKILIPPQPDDGLILYAVAMSPDASTVAVGGIIDRRGSSDNPVFVFDRATGALRKRLRNLPGVVHHLAYSRDGRLAIALSQNHGVRIHETKDYNEIARDTRYTQATYWVEFDNQGRLVTASLDGKLRLYPADFRLPPIERDIPGGRQPFSARFSPNGERIAVGFEDTMAVTVVSGVDLQPLPSPRIYSRDANLELVAWSGDGTVLCAGGKYPSGDRVPILCWNSPDFGPLPPRFAVANALGGLRFLRDRRLAVASALPELGVFDRDGTLLWRKIPEILNLSSPPNEQLREPGNDALRVLRDGVVEFRGARFDGKSWGANVLRFDVQRHELSRIDRFSGAPARVTGLDIRNWQGTTVPTLNGQPLKTFPKETFYSLAISENARSFVLGSNSFVHVHDLDRRRQLPIPTPGEVYGVNFVPNTPYIVAALSDGTLRWYHRETGEEVLALFVHRDLERWLAWTPEGFFDARRGGEALAGYVLGQGADREGEFVKFDETLTTLYRQDLISERFKPGGEKAVADAVKNAGSIEEIVKGGLAPDVRIINAVPSPNGEVTVQFELHDRGGGIGRIGFKVDGTPMSPRQTQIPTVGRSARMPLGPLQSGTRDLAITAENRSGRLVTTSNTARVNVPKRQTASILYVIAAGVSHYRDRTLNAGVQFAAGDARTIATHLKESANSLYDRVDASRVLIDPTRGQLEGSISEVVKLLHPSDAFILYLAGHGDVANGEYYFLPADGQSSSPAALKNSALGPDRLEPLLKQIHTDKALLLIDTCSAAGVESQSREGINRMGTLSHRSVFAAAASGKMALEGSNKHGVFTDAVLAGLTGAQPDKRGRILVTRLGEFIKDRVPEISKQLFGIEQKPEVSINGDPTFAIARR